MLGQTLSMGKGKCFAQAAAANLLLKLLTWAARYDVEMFQKVEALTGLRMEKFECEADAALLLLERTTEAQQMATMQARPWGPH